MSQHKSFSLIRGAHLSRLSVMAIAVALTLPAWAEHAAPATSPEAKAVQHSDNVFASDPTYEDKPYSEEAQLNIYGGKSVVPTPRPLLELGRPIYLGGPLQSSSKALGEKNPVDQSLSVYGDLRTAFARNINGANRTSVLATRLNLDVDYRFTGTERIHAFFRPLDNGAEFSRCEFNSPTRCNGEFDLTPDALFFEGEFAPLLSGFTGKDYTFDLSFAFGKMPLLFQNGLWFEDVLTGVAGSLPAKHSTTFDISNMDITFFAGTNATSGAVRDRNNVLLKKQADLYGLTAFIEANEGYWELGYAYTKARKVSENLDYHNLAVAFTRRYGGWLSNTVRVIHNTGQNPGNGVAKTADGTLVVVENSFITSLPSTLVPYLNVFYGDGKPQSAARAADAGGILKNVGINFETDGLTGFPKLTDAVDNMWGGAVGVQYLFGLNRQLVVEAATTQRHGNSSLPGREVALGLRYQFPLDKAWIFRTDAIVADRAGNQNGTPVRDLAGIRFEIRRKF